MISLRRVTAGAVVLCCGAITSAALDTPSSAAIDRTTASATTVRQISPVDAAGHLAPGFTISHRFGNANCESGSPTIGKAYRCFSPQSKLGIYDSCWVQSDHHYVLCLVTPWMHKAIRLRVNRGFGDSSGFLTVTKPWGVRLDTTTRCQVILGPVHAINGRPRTYLCNHRLVLAGKPTHPAGHWHVRVYEKVRHRGHPLSYKSQGIQTPTIVWYGAPSIHD